MSYDVKTYNLILYYHDVDMLLESYVGKFLRSRNKFSYTISFSNNVDLVRVLSQVRVEVKSITIINGKRNIANTTVEEAIIKFVNKHKITAFHFVKCDIPLRWVCNLIVRIVNEPYNDHNISKLTLPTVFPGPSPYELENFRLAVHPQLSHLVFSQTDNSVHNFLTPTGQPFDDIAFLAVSVLSKIAITEFICETAMSFIVAHEILQKLALMSRSTLKRLVLNISSNSVRNLATSTYAGENDERYLSGIRKLFHLQNLSIEVDSAKAAEIVVKEIQILNEMHMQYYHRNLDLSRTTQGLSILRLKGSFNSRHVELVVKSGRYLRFFEIVFAKDTRECDALLRNGILRKMLNKFEILSLANAHFEKSIGNLLFGKKTRKLNTLILCNISGENIDSNITALIKDPCIYLSRLWIQSEYVQLPKTYSAVCRRVRISSEFIALFSSRTASHYFLPLDTKCSGLSEQQCQETCALLWKHYYDRDICKIPNFNQELILECFSNMKNFLSAIASYKNNKVATTNEERNTFQGVTFTTIEIESNLAYFNISELTNRSLLNVYDDVLVEIINADFSSASTSMADERFKNATTKLYQISNSIASIRRENCIAVLYSRQVLYLTTVAAIAFLITHNRMSMAESIVALKKCHFDVNICENFLRILNMMDVDQLH